MDLFRSNFTKSSILGIIGGGGYGREVLPIAQYLLSVVLNPGCRARIYFVETHPVATEVHGVPVTSEEEFLAMDCDNKFFNIAIADSNVREAIATRMSSAGAIPYSLVAPTANVSESAQVGPGAILSPFSSVTVDSRIGSFFHSNMYSYVAHDCVVGDFVTLGPRVSINGNVHIEDHVYIGTGAVIRQGGTDAPLVIGRGAFIGMGALVSTSVPAEKVMVGYPARETPPS